MNTWGVQDMPNFEPAMVLDLWFPQSEHWRSVPAHIAFWNERMQGGMDEIICSDFAELTIAAAEGRLDHWQETPRERLALVIALDQFPRSLWRDTPAAFGQDIKATRLCLEAVRNGHYDALRETWEREFMIIAMSHCEGPDHLERMDLCIQLAERHHEVVRPELKDAIGLSVQQSERVRSVIQRFGRHPHRNPIYGRRSSPDELQYIAEGDFPHVNNPSNTG